MTSPRSAANGLEPVAAPQVRGEELPRMEPQGGVRSPRAALAKGSPKERAVPNGLCARGPVSVPNLLSCPLPSRSPRIAVSAKPGGPLEEEAVVVEGSLSKLRVGRTPAADARDHGS